MNTKTIKAVALGALFAGGVAFADADAEAEGGWSYAPGEGVSFNEQQIVTAEFGLAFDSRYMTYGVIDGKDPIVTPSATLTVADWVYFGVEAIFDTTKGNGKRGGYGNRAGKYTTLDAIVGAAHEFDIDDDGHTFGVDFNYIYEYIPRHDGSMDDTQYLNLELTLGGYLLEPTFAVERDLMADDGTYINFNIGHTFALVDGETEEDDPVLTFKPSIGQGFGNSKRTYGYFGETSDGFDHAGLMDTTIMGEFEWALCDWLSLSAYVAYSDYWFDSNMRDAARDYNAEWGHRYDNSWNVYGGVALTATF